MLTTATVLTDDQRAAVRFALRQLNEAHGNVYGESDLDALYDLFRDGTVIVVDET